MSEKLHRLKKYLIDLNLVKRASAINQYRDESNVVPRFSRVRDYDNRLLSHSARYNCMITIESFPHNRHSTDIIPAVVSAWIRENDPARKPDLKFNVTEELMDSNTTDIEIEIDFEDNVLITEDENGLIKFNNKTYSLLNYDDY